MIMVKIEESSCNMEEPSTMKIIPDKKLELDFQESSLLNNMLLKFSYWKLLDV